MQMRTGALAYLDLFADPDSSQSAETGEPNKQAH